MEFERRNQPTIIFFIILSQSIKPVRRCLLATPLSMTDLLVYHTIYTHNSSQNVATIPLRSRQIDHRMRWARNDRRSFHYRRQNRPLKPD